MLTVTRRGSSETQQSATTRDAQAPKLKELRWRILLGHVGLPRGQGSKGARRVACKEKMLV